MVRADRTRTLNRFNELDEATARELGVIRRELHRWASTVKLNQDPEMSLRNCHADKWRPLIAVADTLSAEWGEMARAAAENLCAGLQEEDSAVLLLADICTVFNARGVNRIGSGDLVAALLANDDRPWSEWRGIRDDQRPRELTQLELARALRLFGIGPRSIWQPGKRTVKSRSIKRIRAPGFRTGMGFLRRYARGRRPRAADASRAARG
jgi:hypothetical protein